MTPATDADILRAMTDDITRRSTREALALLRGADALDNAAMTNPAARLSPEQRSRIFSDLHSLRVLMDAERLDMKPGVTRDCHDDYIAALNEVIEVLSPRGDGLATTEPPPSPTVAQLRSIEWAGDALSEGAAICPACHAYVSDRKHVLGCWLAAAIAPPTTGADR